MAIHFNCPHCGHHIRVRDEVVGRIGTCDRCGGRLTVPCPPGFPSAGPESRNPSGPTGDTRLTGPSQPAVSVPSAEDGPATVSSALLSGSAEVATPPAAGASGFPFPVDAPQELTWARRARRQAASNGTFVWWSVGLVVAINALLGFATVLGGPAPVRSAVLGVAAVAVLLGIGQVIGLALNALALRLACAAVNRIATACGAARAVVRVPTFLRGMDIMAVTSMINMPVGIVLNLVASGARPDEAAVLFLLVLPVTLMVLACVLNVMLDTDRLWKGFAVTAAWILVVIGIALVIGLVIGLVIALVASFAMLL